MTLSQKRLYMTMLCGYFEVLFLKIWLNKSLMDTTDNDNANDNDLMPSLLCVLSDNPLIYRDPFGHNLTNIRK